MKRKITFVLAVFGATLLAMAVQKPVFLAWYAAEAAGAGFGGWCAVIWHGLSLDATVAGYVTALPLLLTLLSCWVRFPERLWRRVMTGYFVLVALLTAVVFAVDVALYEHWGFRLDSTILIYLADPKEAMASVDWALGVRQTLLGGVYTAAMVWLYGRVLRLFDGSRAARGALCPRRCSSCCWPGATSWRSAAVRGLRWPTCRRSISAPRCSSTMRRRTPSFRFYQVWATMRITLRPILSSTSGRGPCGSTPCAETAGTRNPQCGCSTRSGRMSWW